jgi:hypothetical protein
VYIRHNSNQLCNSAKAHAIPATSLLSAAIPHNVIIK